MVKDLKLGKYLTLANFCTCSQTYQRYKDKISPFPQNPDSISAIDELNKFILDPVIDYFGKERFKLTYGFCSPDLKKYLNQKNPVTGIKNGRIAPSCDQHMAHELNTKGQYYCARLGAACDFLIIDFPSDDLVQWILKAQLPFDSLYFYGKERPIHISYGSQHKRDIWTFTNRGVPTKKGIEDWVELAEKIYSSF
jgi:hypothetical protein